MFVYEPVSGAKILIHLHGFASSVRSSKVEVLRDLSAKRKTFSLFAMDMDYQSTTTTKTIQVLDALVKGFKDKHTHVLLSGSSHGAYVILNYLKVFGGEHINGVILFAPSYSTLHLILAQEEREKYQRWLKGEEPLRIKECETGTELLINKDFAKDILEKGYEVIKGKEVLFPKNPPTEMFIFHGTEDEMVPIDYSRTFVEHVSVKRYLEVEDDHRLTKTFRNLIEDEKLFDLFD
ncbi:MAG: YqiA/YcfP family alpha/beta fold hydrolase [Aquificaceae bacterium]